ncbi:hypothetical protein ACIA58_36685 [Kribbella sp. NPDC051586]|uniref:hypothetical protein n=1 Tax=Kribbella sp. NPDC051586 TaxID=3364118 RepID=UPI0037980DD4
MFQIASVAGYDLQVTLSILESTGNTLSIFLRAILAAIPVWVTLLAFTWIGISAAGSVARRRSLEPLMEISFPMGFVPIFVVLLVLSLAIDPWPLLLLSFAAATFFFMYSLGFSLIIGYLIRRFPKGMTSAMVYPGASVSERIRKRSRKSKFDGFRRLSLQCMLAGLISFVALSGGNWAPYESLSVSSGVPFAGQVVGSDSDRLVVVTGGRNPELLRLPAESTKRSLCEPTAQNTRYGSAQGDKTRDSLWSRQSVLQMFLDAPRFDHKACPSQNRPPG